jgi:hypothetical protein
MYIRNNTRRNNSARSSQRGIRCGICAPLPVGEPGAVSELASEPVNGSEVTGNGCDDKSDGWGTLSIRSAKPQFPFLSDRKGSTPRGHRTETVSQDSGLKGGATDLHAPGGDYDRLQRRWPRCKLCTVTQDVRILIAPQSCLMEVPMNRRDRNRLQGNRPAINALTSPFCALLLLALVTAPAALSCQNASSARMEIPVGQLGGSPDGAQGETTLTVLQFNADQIATASDAESCPVSLRARQSAAASARQVLGGRPGGIAQLLHLTVRDRDSRQVVAASVTVHGYAGQGRIAQTTLGQDRPNAAKVLKVRFVAGDPGQFASDLSVPGFTAAISVRVNSVTFGDGSMWKPAPGEFCTSRVDGLMLVGSR